MPETLRPRPRQSSSAASRRSATPGGLVHAAWLGERTLVLVAWLAASRNGASPAAITLSGPADSSSDVLALGAPAMTELADAPERVLGVLCLPAGATRSTAPALRLARGKTGIELGGDDVAAVLVDVRTLVRESLAGLDAARREQIVPWLAQAVGGADLDAGGYSVSQRLHAVRESLREPRRPCTVAADEPRGLQVDALLAVDDATCWVKGWARDADARVTELALISPEGARGEFLATAMRFPRPDVEHFYAAGAATAADPHSGFAGLAELGAPSRLASGWIVELSDALGESIEVEAPPIVRDPLAVRAAILGDFALVRRSEGTAREELFEPALTRVQARLAALVEVADVRQHGRPPRDPDVSIVVPLYRRIDFLEHQLVQFARDPELAQADLIYVLDSPEDAEALARLAPELHALTGVPFRVVTLTRNAGFSGANNAAAALARGRKLLLLNSDVLPAAPGWLSTMAEFFDATPQIGALAPKLLYEDDSLQHAGMYFLRAPGADVWENMHYFKGLARGTPAANVARPVPTVTAACLMLERERYEQLGGLRGQFVQGDYEDSDLCLRLGELGLESWYLPAAELYHLEAQSYPSELRRTTTAYNTWLHTHLWGDRIAAVMESVGEEVTA